MRWSYMLALIVFFLTQSPDASAELSDFQFIAPTPEQNGLYSGSPFEIKARLNSSNESSIFIDIDSSLISWLDFEDIGNTVGMRGTGYNFDGVSSTLELGVRFTSNNATYAFWINPVDLVNDQNIIAGHDSYSRIRLRDSRISVETDLNGQMLYFDHILSQNIWQHVTITRAGDQWRIFINGEQAQDLRTDNFESLTLERVGGYGARRFFQGGLDEVLIFDRVLKTSEIKVLYLADQNALNEIYRNVSVGQHSIQAYCIDKLGQQYQTELRTFTIDLSLPAVWIETPMENDIFRSRDNSIFIKYQTFGDISQAEHILLRIDSDEIIKENDGEHVFYDVPYGEHMLEVMLVDGSLNQVGQSDTNVFVTENFFQLDFNLSVIQKNILDDYSGKLSDKSDPLVATEVKSLFDNASWLLNSMDETGSWSNSNIAGNIKKAQNHYRQISQLVRAYVTEGQGLYQDDETLAAIQLSMSYIQNYVYPGVDRGLGGWWFWENGIPQYLGPILLVMKPYLSPSVYDDAFAAFSYLIHNDPMHETKWRAPNHVGQNLIWAASNHMYRALLTNDGGHMEEVQDIYESQCASQKGEGIKSDQSFHQHDEQIYNGGYGARFWDHIAHYMLWTYNTSYRLTTNAIDQFSDFVTFGSSLMIYENYWDPSVMGRQAVYPWNDLLQVPDALLMLSLIPNKNQNQAIEIAKSFIENNPNYGLTNESRVKAVMDLPESAKSPIGNKHFYESDFTLHRTTDFYYSIKMLSNRTLPGEYIAGEGKKSWHVSDGMTWLFLSGSDYLANDIFPTMDWARLPGTTVEKKPRAPGEGYTYTIRGTRSFAGNASLSSMSISAMDFEAREGEGVETKLTAKKSWFFFGDKIVALGSNINCASINQVETIVNQRPIFADNGTFSINGVETQVSLETESALFNVESIHIEDIGYYFPNNPDLKIKFSNQEGAWRDLLGAGSPTIMSNPMYTFWFNHGFNPYDASYAYIILPNISTKGLNKFVKRQPFTILQQNDFIHAIKSTGGILGIVFWQEGTFEGIQVDQPAIVCYQEIKNIVNIALSQPEHYEGILTITIDHVLKQKTLPKDAFIVPGKGRTQVKIPVEKGKNYLLKFTK